LNFLDHPHLETRLSTSDQLVAEAAAYTTDTRAEHLCPERDSKPRSEQKKRLLAWVLDSTATGVGLFREQSLRSY